MDELNISVMTIYISYTCIYIYIHTHIYIYIYIYKYINIIYVYHVYLYILLNSCYYLDNTSIKQTRQLKMAIVEIKYDTEQKKKLK